LKNKFSDSLILDNTLRNLSILFILCILFTIQTYSQDTVHVPADYATIQEAIDSANNGDIVLVWPDIYNEHINFMGKAIVVGSLFLMTNDTLYISHTIIDGYNSGSVVTFINEEDSTSVIIGFTLRNGFCYDCNGVYCENSSPSVLYNIIINNGHGNLTGNYGGGIHCNNSNPIISGNKIINNSADWGAGILCKINSNPKIIDNLISENSFGGGIFCTNNSNPTIMNNIISENTNSGIICANSSPNILNNTIIGNISYFSFGDDGYGGGINCTGDSSLPTISNNIITENTADEGTGISSAYGASPLIINNIIVNNIIGEEGIGGAIYCMSSAPTINFCNISSNEGDGILYESSSLYPWILSPIINYNNIINNTGYGVRNLDSAIIVDAQFNWWGDESGPSGAGPGQGDSVSQYIDFEPWLSNPVTKVDEFITSSILIDFKLYQSYPNPFNPSTRIKYSIPQSSNVVIKVFDILGNEIEKLVNEEKQTGTYEITWHAENLPSGVYFYRLQAGDFVKTKKMVLMK